MYNFNHLYYFYLIVKLDGVTKAANYLRTSQSSLSTQMRQFEESLARKLFVKHGRKLGLTSEGQVIYSFCKNSFENFEEMNAFLTNKIKPGLKKLRIGISDEIERPFISSLVAGVVKQDSSREMHIKLHSAKHEEIMEKFLIRDIDVAITSDPFISTGIKYSAVIELPVGIVFCSKTMIKTKRKKENFKTFFKENNLGLALPSSDLKLRKEIDSFLTKNKISRNISFESNIISTLIRFVLDAEAISIVPLVYVEKELKQGHLVQVDPEMRFWVHKLFVYTYSEQVLNDIKNEASNSFKVKVI